MKPNKEDLKSTLNTFLGYQLRRASNAMLSDLSPELAKIELTVTQAVVLLLIDYSGGITQSEIVDILSIKRANMAPLIGILESKGLLIRIPRDGRSQGLVLTAEGKTTAMRALKKINAHEKKFTAKLSSSLVNDMHEALPRFWEE